jgi:hypothetical protein
MEMWVLSDRELNSVAEWQTAIDAEGYPLKFAPDVQLQTHSGFLPSHLRGELTGFECDHWPADEFMRETKQQMPDVDFGHDWKFVLAFRWLGSKEIELLSAWMAGTAYAQATGGVILDGEEGKVRTPAQARELVHDLEHPSPATLAAIEEIKRRRGQKS